MSSAPTIDARRRAAVHLLLGVAGPDASSQRVAEAMVAILTTLGQRVSLLVGSSGASALLERAIGQSEIKLTWSGSRSTQPRWDELLAQLGGRIGDLEQAEACQAAAGLFGLFTGILSRFIGEGLTARVLQDLWPDFFPERNARS
jgi:hypothetical protein